MAPVNRGAPALAWSSTRQTGCVAAAVHAKSCLATLITGVLVTSRAIRSQLEQKRKLRVDAEKRASDYRKKEAAKRSDAAKARTAASRSSSATTVKSKLNEAARREDEANAASRDVASWQAKAAALARQEIDLQARLAKAEDSERALAEARRKREEQAVARQAESHHRAVAVHMTETDARLDEVAMLLRSPKPEKLRILMLAASPEGDLRVGREQKRIRAAVESALHRDLVELDVRTSATATDLLDGIVRFRPHVVHFSGHSDDNLVIFDADSDDFNDGVIVSSGAFARAIAATDDPPLLVLLNSCNSAAQIDQLVEAVTPFAIGMSAEIEDGDAITYATQFYAAIANGQSILSAHRSGRAAVELAGLPGHDLPSLAHAPTVDPASVFLVSPPAD